ncbi:MAG TPA: aryl-sulfate sulfotransferase [Bryobacteraceae bacterium]
MSSSVSSPAPLGTVVTWTANASAANPGTLAYRFRIRRLGANFQTVVDFGPKNTLDWTTIDREGSYEIEVAAMNMATSETAAASSLFQFTPLSSGKTSAVTASSHPLVEIYSAPPCAVGGRMRIQYSTAGGSVQTTPFQDCHPGATMNFYLAGMYQNTAYTAQQILDTGTAFVTGGPLPFTTGAVGLLPPPVTALTNTPVPMTDGVLVQSLFDGNSIATDLNGKLIWYSPGDIAFLTRAVGGGTFLGIGEDGTKDPSQQFVREFDLAGITQAETNAARVNQQLAALGIHAISGFHHEARKLLDGQYLVLAASERILTDIQGAGDVDVIGDTILVLDQDLQVSWAWDSFDHLDTHRTAVFGETCTPAATLACPPFYLSKIANDWLHGNSLQLTPDGNILYSARHQDWVYKIDYHNGAGAGDVLWRMGKQGDFQITSSDPSPWFSHQHDPNFEPNGTVMTVFDDGNDRYAADPRAHSRGQAIKIDEVNRTATLLLNADVGSYSQAVGSAQRLPNGDYHFDSGFIYVVDANGNANTLAQSVELDKAGALVYGIQFAAPEYRTIRMRDLYTAP